MRENLRGLCLLAAIVVTTLIEPSFIWPMAFAMLFFVPVKMENE